ncbi:hypothetical protein [Microbacterium sp. NPDC087665]|uniref:hypothetical protein n=1 Tax=Microbacterium sp. NPDC087665 TaxID=3364194 RepID=UPI00380C9BBB
MNDQTWSAPAQPGHPVGYPTGSPTPPRTFPRVAAETDSRTIWVWLLIAVSVLGLVPSIWVFYEFMRVMLASASLSPTGANSAAIDPALADGFAQWFVLSIVLGWASVAVVAWFAALDARVLRQRGFVRPFHWAWSLLTPLVYVIGRHVVVRRRGGSGAAPLVATIASQAAVFIGGNVLLMSMMARFFADTIPQG